MAKKETKRSPKSHKSGVDVGGRPLIVIDYDTLDRLCSIHCTGEECAAILDIDYDTLNNRLAEDGHDGFSEYFKKKSAKGKMSLRRKQIEIALQGNPTMLIWMGKQQLGQVDKQSTELTGKDGGAIKTEEVNRPKLTKEEWIEAHGMGTAKRSTE